MTLFTIEDLADLSALSESEQVEFKLAGGRDGKGALPQDFWASYCAMANSLLADLGEVIPTGCFDGRQQEL